MYVHYMYVCTIGKGVDGRVVFFSGLSTRTNQMNDLTIHKNTSGPVEESPRPVYLERTSATCYIRWNLMVAMLAQGPPASSPPYR